MSEMWLRETVRRDCKEHGLSMSSVDELKQYCKTMDCYESCWGADEPLLPLYDLEEEEEDEKDKTGDRL